MLPPAPVSEVPKNKPNPGSPVRLLAEEAVKVNAPPEVGVSPTHGDTQTKVYVAPVLDEPVVVVILIAEYRFVASS
jgi:hypothetical protein